MTKVVVKRVKINYTNVFWSFFCLICLGVAAYGVSLITRRGPYTGVCEWESKNGKTGEMEKHDLAETALYIGILTILNWVFAPLVAVVISYLISYIVSRDELAAYTCAVLLAFPTLITAASAGCFADASAASPCLYNQHDALNWFIIASIPAIISSLLFTGSLISAIGHVLFIAIRKLTLLVVKSYKNKRFCCCYIVEEIDVV